MLIQALDFADFVAVANSVGATDSIFYETTARVAGYANSVRVYGVKAGGELAVSASIANQGPDTFPSAADILAAFPSAILIGYDLTITG